MTPRPEDVALPVCPKCGSELRRVLDRRGGWTCTSLRCEKFGQFIKKLAVHRPAPEDVAPNTLETAEPNTLEPVALLCFVADCLERDNLSIAYERAEDPDGAHAIAALRSLASRLEGERRDGVTRLDMGDGEFDEIVGRGAFHVERLSNESVWVRLHDQEFTVWSVARGGLRVTWQEPPQEPSTSTTPTEDRKP